MMAMSNEVLAELRTLTVEELSQATGIRAWRIYALVKQGKAPPHFRVGSTLRFPITGVRRRLEEQVNSARD
jgi:predicted DNA-binding transcriptional regulator AlpA